MKLIVDTSKVPFQAVNRQEFPGVGKIPGKIRDVEGIYYKFLGQDPETGPWVYVVKLPAGYHVQKHSHAADRLEYLLEGEIEFDGEVLSAGCFTFITARVAYEYNILKDTTILLTFNGPPGLMVM